MAQSLSSILSAAMVVFAITMAAFGGLSYGFYEYGASWTGAAFAAGLFTVFGFSVYALRNFLGRYSGRLLFAVWLVAILGSYFAYLFKHDAYPMGIDLAGGSELIYSLDYTATNRQIAQTEESLRIARAKDDLENTKELERQLDTLNQSKKTAPDKAAEVVRRRVDPTGTKGIPVTTLGTDKQRLRIQLPKATEAEVDRITTAIRTQGRLSFHIVPKDERVLEGVRKSTTVPKTYIDPNGIAYEEKFIEKVSQITEKKTETPVVIRQVAEMEGSHVVLAQAHRSQESLGKWEITVRFDGAGSQQFGTLTNNNIGKQMAIVLDGKVYSAPVINSAIYADCLISGDFDEKESNKLAAVLTAGSLPAEVKLESRSDVGPSLGKEQIQSGMTATVIGSAAVIVFMLVYYRFSGLIAAFCTLLNIVMLLGAMGFFKATLTLPGIAGIVLTLGMSVDANVLILERLREELARGRPIKLAVTHGFDRAFLTIIDCNLTTLISGIVLYYLGTGPVRGFAVSLSIGILTTLFCNLWLNWILTEWIVSRDAIANLSFMQFFKTPNFNVMGWRRFWITLTGTMALAAAALFFFVPSDRIYDVDFTGGTLIQFNFSKDQAQSFDEVKNTVEKQVLAGLQSDIAQTVAGMNEALKAGDQPEQYRPYLLAKVPDGEVIAKEADTRANRLKDFAAELEAAAAKIKAGTEDFTTQSFGTAQSPGKYISFTVTTKLQNPLIIRDLRKQLSKVFEGKLEPEPVVADSESVRIRFAKTDLTAGQIQELLTPALVSAAADATDPAVKLALPALKVANVAMDGNYLAASITGLPADAALRAKVADAVKPLRLTDKINGPISRVNIFGSQVAGEMKWQALLALVIANIGVWIYLWFRFEFSGAWGFGAIAALVHDVVIAAGAVVAANLIGSHFGFTMMFNLNTVAALLTIVGFSVNDTIVVFDRIREVKAAHPTRQFEDIVNEAVNATLSRTILTSLTVLLADIALLIFGGPTIRDMAFTLLVGFTVGTYSSIYIASPLMIWWYRRFGAGMGTAPAAQKPAVKDDTVGAQV